MFRRKKAEKPQTADYIVAGLGNPGSKYAMTRHNAGFIAADALCAKYGARMRKVKNKALYELISIEGKNVLVMKPQTYMNLSGEAVRDMAKAYCVPPERVLVIFDDAAIKEGSIRIKRNGSDGGHNGIKNIIYQLESDAFPRIKIGIGDKGENDMADFVLSDMEGDVYKTASETAPEAAVAVITLGIDEAMQRFNNKQN